MEDKAAWLTCLLPYRNSSHSGHCKGPHELEWLELKASGVLQPNERRLPQGGVSGQPSLTVTVGMRESRAAEIVRKYAGGAAPSAPSTNGYQSPAGIEAD